MNTEETEKFTRILMSVCYGLARDEGIDNDEALVMRANELYRKAKSDYDESIAGNPAIDQALKAYSEDKANPVESPYTETKFDYSQHADETIVPAVIEILKLFSQYADEVGSLAKSKEITKDEDRAMFSAFQAMSIDTFAILNANAVGMSKYQAVFAKLKEIVSFLEDVQVQQMTGHRHEVLSRVFGGINPGTGKLDANYATYADLLASREKAKAETDGPDGEDNFRIAKGTQSDDE